MSCILGSHQAIKNESGPSNPSLVYRAHVAREEALCARVLKPGSSDLPGKDLTSVDVLCGEALPSFRGKEKSSELRERRLLMLHSLASLHSPTSIISPKRLAGQGADAGCCVTMLCFGGFWPLHFKVRVLVMYGRGGMTAGRERHLYSKGGDTLCRAIEGADLCIIILNNTQEEF